MPEERVPDDQPVAETSTPVDDLLGYIINIDPHYYFPRATISTPIINAGTTTTDDFNYQAPFWISDNKLPRKEGMCHFCPAVEDLQIITAVHELIPEIKICPNCLKNLYATCAYCNSHVRTHFLHSSPDSERICGICFDERYYYCHDCNRIGDLTSSSDYQGHLYCALCWATHFVSCIDCDRVVHENSARYAPDDEGPFCSTCWNRCEKLPSTTFLINSSKRFVGFEIEYFADRSPNLTKYGDLHEDGSIRPPSNNEDCVLEEFSSHISCGDRLFELIDEVCYQLSKVNAGVNKSCGFHVHIDVSDMSKDQQQNIRNWWKTFERVFFSVVAPSRRTNEYTLPVANMTERSWGNNRYHSLNICAFEKFGTYEVRLHQGTTNADRIKNWITVLLSFFETFSQIDFAQFDEHLQKISEREKLIFFFKQLKLRMTFRKYVMQRIREFKSRESGYIKLEKVKVS